MRKSGYYEKLGNIEYFIPFPLPPKEPFLQLDNETIHLYGETMNALGKLNEMTNNLPEKKHFIKAYVIKEALLSSAIEGINTTLLEMYTQPFSGTKPNKDTQLVMNYQKSLDVAIALIKEGLPISSRIILSAHEVLMQSGEGDKSNPGHYREQSVKVGNLVPPPFKYISNLMSELEQFINSDESITSVIKAGLAHAQFEIIHPFLDGNGRIGRLLIVLMLIDNKILSEPILYPSYYFKKYHFEYYNALDNVRTNGDFEGWIKFYLTAIKESAIDAYKRAQEIELLRQNIMDVVSSEKNSTDMIKALSIFFIYPIININELKNNLEVSYNTAKKIISRFIELGFIVEETKQRRDKLFRFKTYLDILERD